VGDSGQLGACGLPGSLQTLPGGAQLCMLRRLPMRGPCGRPPPPLADPLSDMDRNGAVAPAAPSQWPRSTAGGTGVKVSLKRSSAWLAPAPADSQAAPSSTPLVRALRAARGVAWLWGSG
jgi:hypothetical protein